MKITKDNKEKEIELQPIDKKIVVSKTEVEAPEEETEEKKNKMKKQKREIILLIT
jgi:hypothetical protein